MLAETRHERIDLLLAQAGKFVLDMISVQLQTADDQWLNGSQAEAPVSPGDQVTGVPEIRFARRRRQQAKQIFTADGGNVDKREFQRGSRPSLSTTGDGRPDGQGLAFT